VVYTENLFVKFVDELEEAECRDILSSFGLVVKREVDYSTNAYFVSAPEGTGQAVFDIAERLLARKEVELCQPELVRDQGRRTISPRQWHLAKTPINGQTIDASANVAAAHRTSTGKGATIAIIDDGVDIDHEEFARRGKVVAPRDVTSADADPRPASSDDDHGTACAGVACADGRFEASGVAPDAKLMPIRMASALGSQQEADAFAWAANNGADVISCSWGPDDGRWFNPADPLHTQVVPLPDSTRLAIEHAITKGRDGKGCLIFFAAGNGNESVSNDGYASSPHVLAVAACNDRGRRSVYSDFGPAVFCSFPSNDFGWTDENRPEPLTPGIWTTDITGTRGSSPSNYRDDFGGTSSACPGAAGVAALVLACAPELARADVIDILRRACVPIDPAHGDYDSNGRSPWYGYGRLDAAEAVRLASTPRDDDVVEVGRIVKVAVPDLGSASVALDVAETAVLKDVEVDIDIRHPRIGDLVVTLRPPAGTAPAVTLHDRSGGRGGNLKATFTAADVAGLAALRNTSPAGTWTLDVLDRAEENVGTIRRFRLRLTVERTAAPGEAPPPSGTTTDRSNGRGGRRPRASSTRTRATPPRDRAPGDPSRSG
jgi:subtilisin-like proprotein convertase family protein